MLTASSATTGYLSEDELKNSPGIPSESRRRKGPVAVIECLEDIPCNPCESSCKAGAIVVGNDITNLPHLDGEKCIACQTCVYICPGQAIFMVDESLADDKATIMMPYEYRPLPEKGDIVTALDRSGRELGDAIVIAVRQTKRMDQTATVTIEVVKDWSMQARAIRIKS
ncbi:4Fe-4S binding protein [Desulfosarcina sp.]|uniref:4Fe-4S binding protein n=1 Tax=Desulfosarcina sp. TaxID=2027861 RepID=UPI003970CFAC